MFMSRWRKENTKKKKRDIEIENKRGEKKKSFFFKESDKLSKHEKVYK